MSRTCELALPSIVTPSPAMGFDDWMDAENVFDAIQHTQSHCGEKIAVTLIGTNPQTPPRKLNYSELVEGIARTANAFRSLGLRRGDVVADMLPSLVETQFVLWGATTAAAALPLNPLLRAEDIAVLCRTAGVKALVALGPLPGTEIWDKALRVKALAPELGALIQVGGSKAANGADVHLLADLLRSNSPQLSFTDRPALDDVAAYFHTGGTTGEVPVAYITLRPGVEVTEDELMAFTEATIHAPPAVPRRFFVLKQLPLTAVGKIFKSALRQDCAQRHLREVLQGEPITALTVREDPSRGQVVCIELAPESSDDSVETHLRIAAKLKGYLLTLEWAQPTTSHV